MILQPSLSSYRKLEQISLRIVNYVVCQYVLLITYNCMVVCVYVCDEKGCFVSQESQYHTYFIYGVKVDTSCVFYYSILYYCTIKKLWVSMGYFYLQYV